MATFLSASVQLCGNNQSPSSSFSLLWIQIKNWAPHITNSKTKKNTQQSLKTAASFCLGLACRLERVHVGSCSLCVGCCSHYGGCYGRGVGCCSLHVGYATAMWAVTISAWSIAGAMGAVSGTAQAAQALCGMLQPLYGLLWFLRRLRMELHGLLQHLRRLTLDQILPRKSLFENSNGKTAG